MQGTHSMSWTEFLSLPDDDLLRHEVLLGVHCASRSPGLRHQEVLGRLMCAWMDQAERNHATVLLPVVVKLSPMDFVQPDLFVVLARNRARIGEEPVDGPPDLAIEIVVPDSSHRDRTLKRARYAAGGIPEYWIVDPHSETVEQLVLEGDAYRLAGEHRERVAAAILPDVVIELCGVFAVD